MENVVKNSNVEPDLTSLIQDAEALVRGLKNLKKSRRRYIGPWCITSTKGFFRAVRRVDGKVHSVHIGRQLIDKRAAEKIRDYEFKSGIATPLESELETGQVHDNLPASKGECKK